jgi:hypothetical protein
MEREENRPEPPHPAEIPARSPLKLVLSILLALVPGISIVLILNIFNHGGWFALLGGLSGMLLYSLLALVQWVFGIRLVPGTPSQNRTLVGAEAQRAFLVMVCPWLLIYALLTVGGVVGLFFLSEQQSPLYAVISGALGLLVCISAFRLVMFIGVAFLVLFFAEKIERRLATPADEQGILEDERAP